MTAAEAKAICVRALKSSMGDDLERAKAAFRGLPASEMAKQYGQSGLTRQQILDEYQAERDLRNEALAWLESQ